MSLTSGRMIPSFITDDGTATYNRELFRTDGTAEGTYRVKDINPGFEPSIPTDFIRYNHFVFFSANDGLHGTELWRTDGTDSGTMQVADLNPGKIGSGPQYPILARFQPPRRKLSLRIEAARAMF